MQTLKHIGAIIVGFLTVVVLSILTDFILERAGVFPNPSEGLFITWMLILAFVYRSAYTVFGGFITAKLSPVNPMRNVKILGVVGTIAGIGGVIAGWDLSDHWYPIALAVTAYLFVWWGGKLATKKAEVVQPTLPQM